MAPKKRRQTSRPPPSTGHAIGLVPMSCPDCFGVLSYEREGSQGHLLYRCQVEHRYTTGSLLEAKEGQLERIFWSAALALRQLCYAYEDLLGELHDANSTERKRVQQRMKELRKQGLAIQTMIEATHAVE